MDHIEINEMRLGRDPVCDRTGKFADRFDASVANWYRLRYVPSAFTYCIKCKGMYFLAHPKCSLYEIYRRLCVSLKVDIDERPLIIIGFSVTNSFLYDHENPVLVESVFKAGRPVFIGDGDYFSFLWCDIALYDWSLHSRSGIRVRLFKDFNNISWQNPLGRYYNYINAREMLSAISSVTNQSNWCCCLM
jgi:hypothetical protein